MEHNFGKPDDGYNSTEWKSLSEALSDPDREVRVSRRRLEAWISVEVESQVRERLAELAKTISRMPPAAEVLGPQNSPNWGNGNAVRRAREATLVRVDNGRKITYRAMTQKELAVAVGVAQPQISDLERHGYVPTGHDHLLDDIARELKVDVETLKTRYNRQGR